MSPSRTRVILLLVALAAIFVLGLAAVLLRWDTGFAVSQMLLGIIVIGVGLFRSRFRRWLGAGEDHEELRPFVQLTVVLLGANFLFFGAARLLHLPPPHVLLIQVAILVPAIIAALAALARWATGGAE